MDRVGKQVRQDTTDAMGFRDVCSDSERSGALRTIVVL